MSDLKAWARERYSELLRSGPVYLRGEHYQCRFDRDRFGMLRTALRLACGRRDGTGDTEERFLCYPLKRQMDTDQLAEMLLGYDVISFDVFDTLLFRRVDKPTDVFSVLEREWDRPGFARDRERAEREAREESLATEGTVEVVIDDIYKMPAMLAYGPAEELIREELDAEKACCYANPVMKDIFDRLCTAQKRIVVTSDMYLSKTFIRALLEGLGYSGVEKCFVSCAFGVDKSRGLFDILSSYCGEDTTVVHIGDNFSSDIFPLKGREIMPVHYLTGGIRQRMGKGVPQGG